MYNLRVQPWEVVTRTWMGGRNMEVVRFIATLPSGDKQVEVKNPDKGFNYYVFKDDLPEAKPWYQVFGQGTFKGVGLGVEFKKLPSWLRYLTYGAIALAIAYVYKKLNK
jgi:hypothetical protein